MKCPYKGKRISEGLYQCGKLSDACGFTCTVPEGLCQAHIKAGGWDVPVEEVAALRESLKRLLRGRIISGACPRYQGPNPVDLADASRKLKVLAAPDELEEVFAKAVEKWASIPENQDGHTVETVERDADTLAREWKIDVPQVVEKLD